MEKAFHSDLPEQGVAFDVSDMLHRSIALIGIYDQNEILRYSNEAFRKTYHVKAGEQIDWQTLMRRNFEAGRGTVIKTDDIENWISSVRSRRGKSRERIYESDLHDGRFIWVTETKRDDGWIIYVGTDITSLNVSERNLRLANDKLFRQSCTDELTGVSNRRHILTRLKDMLNAGQDAWACLLDVDHFKKINDTYGHNAGDNVLVRIAQTARETIKLNDSFGRVGGEEFLILFVSQPLEEVKATLVRLQQAIGGLKAVVNHPELKVTISGGLTHVPFGDTQEKIIRRADLGLYSAKNDGRNRIYLYKRDDEFEDIRSSTSNIDLCCGMSTTMRAEHSAMLNVGC